MKKIVYFAFTIFLLIGGCSKENPINDPINDPIIEQSGTVDHPYLIKTKQDLMQVRDRVNYDNANYPNKVYKLMSDLDFTGEPCWIPIGSSTVPFQGIFDGNGKVIKNIKIGIEIKQVNIFHIGLFGYASGAEIKNLGVQCSIVNDSYNSFIGGIVGYVTDTNITNCYSSGTISCRESASSDVGGIAGYEKKSCISNCYSTCSLLGSFVGGICGESEGTISICYSSGYISGTFVGGIAGIAAKIINCYSAASVVAYYPHDQYVGGIAGMANSIINCYSTGNISGSYVGGIAGSAANIINCYSSGDISSIAPDYSNISLGGIAGEILSSSYSNLALNKNLMSICNYDWSNTYINRISGTSNICTALNNFASSTMIVKKGRSESTLTTITDFSNIKNHGSDLIDSPVNLLNNYVVANPTYEGISLLKWKAELGVNNGFPIFLN